MENFNDDDDVAMIQLNASYQCSELETSITFINFIDEKCF